MISSEEPGQLRSTNAQDGSTNMDASSTSQEPTVPLPAKKRRDRKPATSPGAVNVSEGGGGDGDGGGDENKGVTTSKGKDVKSAEKTRSVNTGATQPGAVASTNNNDVGRKKGKKNSSSSPAVVHESAGKIKDPPLKEEEPKKVYKKMPIMKSSKPGAVSVNMDKEKKSKHCKAKDGTASGTNMTASISNDALLDSPPAEEVTANIQNEAVKEDTIVAALASRPKLAAKPHPRHGQPNVAPRKTARAAGMPSLPPVPSPDHAKAKKGSIIGRFFKNKKHPKK